MRQAAEAQVLNPHFELGEQGLRQILSDVIEEVRRSVSRDIDGAEILHSLLNSPWLQSLLKVYECLQRYLRDSPTPALDYGSGLSLQLLIDIRSSPCLSEEAKELYHLLQQPHLQALLSAHDTVAQKDYEPVLPPMPDELPDDEEATRIVCLVKNKQPLLCGHCGIGLPGASPPRAKNPGEGIQNHWRTVLHRDEGFGVKGPAVDSSWSGIWRGSCPRAESQCHPAARPYPPPQYKPMGCCQVCCNKPMSQCRVCHGGLLWEQRLNHSAPSVYSHVRIDDHVEDEAGASTYLLPTSCGLNRSPSGRTVPCYPSVGDYLHPGLPPYLRGQSPRIRTAPPSPMRPHRLLEKPPVELPQQESLHELRTTVPLAASSMESSTKDIKLLGEKVAAAMEHMTETVQDNSQALGLLTQVVDRLQTLLATTRTETSPLKAADLKQCSSLSPRSRSSSSRSSNSSLNATSAFKAAGFLSRSRHGSPRAALKTKNTPLQQMENNRTDVEASRHSLTNGLRDEPKETSNSVMGCWTKKRKKETRELTNGVRKPL
ncbi:uncharacterized protein mpp4b isoform 2-T2 [Odontesthes bonariensis]